MCWYYCTIERCQLKGTSALYSSLPICLEHSHTVLKHVMGEPKSFKLRNVKCEERKALAKEVVEISFPSKVYHQRLVALDEKCPSIQGCCQSV